MYSDWSYDEYNTLVIRLKSFSDEKLSEFNKGLTPGAENVLGIRMPILRNIAKEIAKSNWKQYLNIASNYYYEELMLQGLVIGYINDSYENILEAIKDFIPKINTWAICDSFCAGLKFVKKNRQEFYQFLQHYLYSKKEFECRFAVIMLLFYFIEESYIDNVLQLCNNVEHCGYYVKMGIAWAISVCFVKYEIRTLEYLYNNKLDDFTYNKALQKIIESSRVNDTTKTQIRQMKRTYPVKGFL